MEIKTKSRGGCCRLRLIGADGDASQKTSFPSCHHRHHQCHALHDANCHHGSKSGRRPFKKSAFGGEKIAACGMLLFNSPQGARMLTWCGSHSGCVGWMEHESRRILNLRKCSIYLIIYMYLSAWVGESMVCICKVQVVKDIVEDILLWGLSCLGMSGS